MNIKILTPEFVDFWRRCKISFTSRKEWRFPRHERSRRDRSLH